MIIIKEQVLERLNASIKDQTALKVARIEVEHLLDGRLFKEEENTFDTTHNTEELEDCLAEMLGDDVDMLFDLDWIEQYGYEKFFNEIVDCFR